MTDLSFFAKELVPSNGTAKPGDHLYAARPVDNEDIPAGSIGCFVPEELILEETKILKTDRDSLFEDIKILKIDYDSLLEDIKVLKRHQEMSDAINQGRIAAELINDIAQLVYGLEHIKIVSMINNSNKTDGHSCLRFNEAFKNPLLVDRETYMKIIGDQTYKDLTSLVNMKSFNLIN